MLSSRLTRGTLAETWSRRHRPRAGARWPERDASDDGQLDCDTLGCVLRSKGWTIAITLDSRAFAEDCAAADMVISAVPVRIPCLPPVVDCIDLWGEGTYGCGQARAGGFVSNQRSCRGRRLWTRISSHYKVQ